MHYADAAQREIKQKLQSYANVTIVRTYEAFKKFWEQINDGSKVEFNSSFIASILDNAYEETLRKEKHDQKADLLKSPLFNEVSKQFPSVDLNDLRKQMIAKRGDFMSAICAIELNKFSKTIPNEYKDLYTQETWETSYFKHVRKYEDTWRNTYKTFYLSIRKEQELWKKALTS